MITIQTLSDTVLKSTTGQSNKLSPYYYTHINKNTIINGNNTYIIQDHLYIELDVPIDNFTHGFLWLPHIKIKEVNLAVPYLSQLDNIYKPYSTCNVTSCAMVIEYYFPKNYYNFTEQLEDKLAKELINIYGANSIFYHDKLVEILKKYKVNSNFKTNHSWESVKNSLINNNPVIMSGTFTKSGHIIVLKGFNEKGFYVNDPYGEWNKKGYNTKKSGRNLFYSYDVIYSCSYGGSESTWAHLTSFAN